jgi:hypothetical protein
MRQINEVGEIHDKFEMLTMLEGRQLTCRCQQMFGKDVLSDHL